MKPEVDQKISVYFKNGVQIEGVVVEWTDQKSVLKSEAGTSFIVINNTLEDVLLYKFSLGKEEYERLRAMPIRDEVDIKRIAELKKELNELEREEIRDKLRDHHANGMRKVSYGLPHSTIEIESSIKHPGEKTPQPNTNIGSELQNLFTKRN